MVAGFPTSDYQKENTTDYDIELDQIRKHIVKLKDDAFIHPVEVDPARSLIHLLYRQASLTMSYSDVEVAKTAIDNANEAPRSKLRGITELNSEDFSEGEANPVASYGECQVQQSDASEEFYILKAVLDFKFHQLPSMKSNLKLVTALADSLQVKTLKADLALQEGRYGDVKSEYEDIIAKKRTWDNLARLAYLKSKFGDVFGANNLYLEAQAQMTAKEMRSFSWLELQTGLLDFSRGRHKEALAHYQRANKAYSGYWLVEAHIAEVFGSLGRFDEAVALYERLINRTAKPELQQALGDLYLFMGKPLQAKS